MTFTARATRSVRVAALLALALTAAASVPALTTAPFGNTSVVQPTAARTYIRVSSMTSAVRATYMYMPRIGISMPIKGGPLRTVLSTRYAYHYPTTSWPGGGSNTYLFAHAQAGAFLKLKYAHVGDVLIFRLKTGYYLRYKVTRVVKVAWNAGKWVLPTNSERITLQTCLGHTKTAPRLIVIAKPAY